MSDKLEEQFEALMRQGHSLREIAKATGATYYQVQKLYAKRKEKYMTTLIHYRTIVGDNGNEALLRMLPYDLAADACSFEEALATTLALKEQGVSPGMAVEVQIQPDIWVGFDYDCLYGSRENQIRTFYSDITLKDFANSLSFQLCSGGLMQPYNKWMLKTAIAERVQEDKLAQERYVPELSQEEIGKQIIKELKEEGLI
jgi:hypothetical protein